MNLGNLFHTIANVAKNIGGGIGHVYQQTQRQPIKSPIPKAPFMAPIPAVAGYAPRDLGNAPSALDEVVGNFQKAAANLFGAHPAPHAQQAQVLGTHVQAPAPSIAPTMMPGQSAWEQAYKSSLGGQTQQQMTDLYHRAVAAPGGHYYPTPTQPPTPTPTPPLTGFAAQAAPIFQKYQIPLAVGMGQYAAEGRQNGLGAQRNNFFNINAVDSNPQAAFAFPSPQAGIEAYAKLLATNPRYSNAYSLRNNPDAMLRSIAQSGYAGDPRTYQQRTTAVNPGTGQKFKSYADLVESTPEWKQFAGGGQ